ncbi:MAG: imipenem/basic amino acid-specific outer membrane pore [Sulfurimonas sp.]|jgi:imipenem/basic amino acid-specific outer membrane pore
MQLEFITFVLREKESIMIKKTILLSCLLSANAFATDAPALNSDSASSTLENAFTNGKVEGQLQLFYYDIDKSVNSGDAYATAIGGHLKYTTDTKNALYASAGFHTSNSIGEYLNRTKTSMFNNDKDGDVLTVISEAFLGYKTKNRSAKIGDLRLKSPMMNDDTTRFVPWSFQGLTYEENSIKDTKIELYYIKAIRSNTSEDYDQTSGSGKFGDSGISMASLKYSGIEGLKINAYYYYAPELYSTFMTQTDYKTSINDYASFIAGLQYYNSGNGGKYADTTSKNGGDDINFLSLRSGLESKDGFIIINYSQNFGFSGLVKGYGGLAKAYTTSMIANGRGNNKPETWMIRTAYNLPLGGYKDTIAATYTNSQVHVANATTGFDAYYLHFKHYFNKDTTLYMRYENLQYETGAEADYFRTILTYKF